MTAVSPEELERRLDDLVQFIWSRQTEGFLPTIPEMARGVERSVGAVHHDLEILAERGIITRERRKPRTMAVLIAAHNPRTGRLYRLAHRYEDADE